MAYIGMSHVTHRMRHVTHIDESRCTHEGLWHTYECIAALIGQGICGWYSDQVLRCHMMARIQMSHVIRMNESFHTYQCVMARLSICRGTRLMSEFVGGMLMESWDRISWHTYVNESCHTYG